MSISTSIDLPPPLGPTIAMCSPSHSSKSTGSAIRHSGILVTPFSILIIFCIYKFLILNSFLVLIRKVLPTGVVLGSCLGAAHLQEMAVGSTESVGGVHKLAHLARIELQQTLQHSCHLFLRGLSLSRYCHLDFQRGI